MYQARWKHTRKHCVKLSLLETACSPSYGHFGVSCWPSYSCYWICVCIRGVYKSIWGYMIVHDIYEGLWGYMGVYGGILSPLSPPLSLVSLLSLPHPLVPLPSLSSPSTPLSPLIPRPPLSSHDSRPSNVLHMSGTRLGRVRAMYWTCVWYVWVMCGPGLQYM